MARGRKKFTSADIQRVLDEKTSGLYTYISDEKFPYKNERSKIIIYNTKTKNYFVSTLYYIHYQKKI